MLNTNYIYEEPQSLLIDATTISPTQGIVSDESIFVKPDLQAQEGQVKTDVEGTEIISLFNQNIKFINETQLQFTNDAWSFINGVNELWRKNSPTSIHIGGLEGDKGTLFQAYSNKGNNQREYIPHSTQEQWNNLPFKDKLYLYQQYKQNIIDKETNDDGTPNNWKQMTGEFTEEDVSIYQNASNANLVYESWGQFQNQHLKWMQQNAIQGDAQRNQKGLSTFKYPYLSSLFKTDDEGNVSMVDEATWRKGPEMYLKDVKSQAWSIQHLPQLLTLNIPDYEKARLQQQFDYINRGDKSDPQYMNNVTSYLKEIHKKYSGTNYVQEMASNYLNGVYGPNYTDQAGLYKTWGKQYFNKDITSFTDISSISIEDELDPKSIGGKILDWMPRGGSNVGFPALLQLGKDDRNGYQSAINGIIAKYDELKDVKGGPYNFKSFLNPAYIGTNRGGAEKSVIQIAAKDFGQTDINGVLDPENPSAEFKEFRHIMFHFLNPNTSKYRLESSATVDDKGARNVDPNYISFSYNPTGQTIEGCKDCFIDLDKKGGEDDKKKNMYQYFAGLLLPNVVNLMSDNSNYTKTKQKKNKETVVWDKSPKDRTDFVLGTMTFIPTFTYNGKQYVGYHMAFDPKFIDKKLTSTKGFSKEQQTVDDDGNVVTSTESTNKSDASQELITNFKTNGLTILMPVNVAKNLQYTKTTGEDVTRQSKFVTQYEEAVNNTPLEIWFGNNNNREYKIDYPGGGGYQITKDFVEYEPGKTKPQFTINYWGYELQEDGSYKKVQSAQPEIIQYEQIFSLEQLSKKLDGEFSRSKSVNSQTKKKLNQ